MADLKRFFKKTVSEDRHKQAASVSVPEGLWIKCPKCGEMVYREDVISNAYVCPKCGGYFRISAKRRIKMIADKGSFKEWFTGIDNSNPLDYPDYPQKIENLKEKTHLDEAILIGEATIEGIRTVIGAMDTRFLMASMGYVVGEKITRSFEEATKCEKSADKREDRGGRRCGGDKKDCEGGACAGTGRDADDIGGRQRVPEDCLVDEPGHTEAKAADESHEGAGQAEYGKSADRHWFPCAKIRQGDRVLSGSQC